MPRELVAIAPRTPVLREYDELPLQPGEIRVVSEYGAVKHGTELHMYRADSPFADSHWDRDRRLFVAGAAPTGGFPISLGNMAVGRVSEIGPAVDGLVPGDRVVGYGPLRESHRWSWVATGAYPGVRKVPAGMDWRAAVCLDPVTVALGGVRDGQVRLGDRVAVFGLGAIGLMTVQLARVSGAGLIVAIDPIARRREIAANTGANLVIDPVAADAGLLLREATNGIGVDVAIETSGNPRALHHAIRGLGFRGTVAVVAWYNEIRGGLDLGREAHFNRPRLVFPRAESEPHDDHPRWDNRRQADAAWALLAGGRLDCSAIVTPVVAFEEVVAAYQAIDQEPEAGLKLGVRFASAPA